MTEKQTKEITLSSSEFGLSPFVTQKRSFTFLFIGSTGVGKSSLINRLFGEQVSKVGHFNPTTHSPAIYTLKINSGNTTLNIVDSPGLSENESQDIRIFNELQKKVNQIDCLLYLTPLDSPRFLASERWAIQIINKVFGEEIWDRTAILLTRADIVPYEDYNKYLEQKVKIIHNEISKIILPESANNIPAIAVTALDQFTPDGKNWIEDFFEILLNIVSKAANSYSFHERSIQTASITFESDFQESLSPNYLSDTVNPYLKAIANIQNIIDSVRKVEYRKVSITSIRQNSPISVNLDGASQAIQVATDFIVPWKRKHSQQMAQLAILEKEAEIENKKAEVLEKRARASKDRAEAERFNAESIKQRKEAEKLGLENEKLRLELQHAKIQLSLDVLKQISPHLSETEKIAYLIKLLPSVDVLVFSELEITTKFGDETNQLEKG